MAAHSDVYIPGPIHRFCLLVNPEYILWLYSYHVIENELLPLASGRQLEYIVCPDDLHLVTGHSASHRLQVNVTSTLGENMTCGVMSIPVLLGDPSKVQTEIIIPVGGLMKQKSKESILF